MSPALGRLRTGIRVGRTLGPGWVAYRAGYAAQQWLGLLERRCPVTRWADRPLSRYLRSAGLADRDAYREYRRESAAPFFFAGSDRPAAGALFERWDSAEHNPVAAADRILAGVFPYFGDLQVECGFPPDWHRNALTGERAPDDRHWSRIDEFAHGDVKVIWEPSRFGTVFPLLRAYWRTGNPVYPEVFWTLVESWRDRNPPNVGVNWKCGQETSLRVLAWVFGLYGFLDAPSSTSERVASLTQMIAVSGERIAGNIQYALSQQNNHGISEGLGLWLIGLVFPEFRAAPIWRERGRSVLEALARTLIYDDGGFCQHALNYQRLMLHDYLCAIRLGDIAGQPLSDELRGRVGRSAALLYQLQDEFTGRVPNYGHNDGSLVLPLSNCEPIDYRPVLQSARYLADGSRYYPDGPWDEELLWLFGEQAVGAPVTPRPRDDLAAIDGGYYTLRSRSGFAFTRCATYRHRPGQADQLHVDVWWRGLNVAMDPGTFSYNGQSGRGRDLAGTGRHNTVVADGRDQMDRAGRFLWLPWAQGRASRPQRSPSGRLAYWEGAHSGYERLPDPVSHRRAVVRLGDEHWLVLDSLDATRQHRYRLSWLLPDWPITDVQGERDYASVDSCTVTFGSPSGPYRVTVGMLGGSDAAGTSSGCRATASSHSPSYRREEPALSLFLDSDCQNGPVRLVSLLGPPGPDLTVNGSRVLVTSPNWSAVIHTGAHVTRALVDRVEFTDQTSHSQETWEPAPCASC